LIKLPQLQRAFLTCMETILSYAAGDHRNFLRGGREILVFFRLDNGFVWMWCKNISLLHSIFFLNLVGPNILMLLFFQDLQIESTSHGEFFFWCHGLINVVWKCWSIWCDFQVICAWNVEWEDLGYKSAQQHTWSSMW
jgi:hypothetical protein